MAAVTAAPPAPIHPHVVGPDDRRDAGRPNAAFVSCPISNLVIGGSKTIADITTPYDNLVRRHGVRSCAIRSPPSAPSAVCAWPAAATLPYDRLVLSPGIDFMWEALPGLKRPARGDGAAHAWKAGPQTVALRRQLEAMPMAACTPSIPRRLRCPPGPTTPACQVAHYFNRQARSKVLIPSTPTRMSPQGTRCSRRPGRSATAGIVEYRPRHAADDVAAQHAQVRVQRRREGRRAQPDSAHACRHEIAVKDRFGARPALVRRRFLTQEAKAAEEHPRDR